MQLNTTMSAQELAAVTRETTDVNNGIRRPDGSVRDTNMGKDAFLRLLVTQLRHQDPTQPMQDREFIAQMAQFSSLEQMTNMNTAMQTMQSSNRAAEAYSLLGKRVEAFNPVTADTISGTVSRVAVRDNTYVLTVNNREVELGNVQAVYSTENGRRPGAEGGGAGPAAR